MLEGPPRRRRTRGRSPTRREHAVRWRTLCAVAVCALVACVVVLDPSKPRPASSAADFDVATSHDGRPPVAETHHSWREVYPYSVVPGGVYTTRELADAVADDPAVAEHYADIALPAMRVTVVDSPREAYMSYRLGDRIFWTTRKLRLREGERILTNGDVAIRARCGNRLSDVPMMPTSEVEPAADEFERQAAPLAPVVRDADLPLAGSPSELWPGDSGPFGIAPFFDGANVDSFLGGTGVGGVHADLGMPPIGGTSAGTSELQNAGPPIAFVLPLIGDAGHPDSPVPGNGEEVPIVSVEVPGFTHVDHPGARDGGSTVGPSGETVLVPELSGGSDGELPPAAVVPEPTTLTLLGTGLLWGALKRRRRRRRLD